MTTQVKPYKANVFDFSNLPITATKIDGEPWFSASDVAKVLKLRDVWDMKRFLKVDMYKEAELDITYSTGEVKRHTVTVINKVALYKAIMKSDTKIGEKLFDWVTEEILPQLEKTGTYSTSVASLPSPVIPVQRIAADLDQICPAFHLSTREREVEELQRREAFTEENAEPGFFFENDHPDLLKAAVTSDVRRSNYRQVILQQYPKANELFEQWKVKYPTYETLRSSGSDSASIQETTATFERELNQIKASAIQVLEDAHDTVISEGWADEAYLEFYMKAQQRITEHFEAYGMFSLDDISPERVYSRSIAARQAMKVLN